MSQILVYGEDGTLVFDTNGTNVSRLPPATLPLGTDDTLLVIQNGNLASIPNSMLNPTNILLSLPAATLPYSEADKILVAQGGQLKLGTIPSGSTTTPPTTPTGDDEVALQVISNDFTPTTHTARLLIANLTNLITITLPMGATEADEVELFGAASIGSWQANIVKSDGSTFLGSGAIFYVIDTSNMYGKFIFVNGNWQAYNPSEGKYKMNYSTGG